MRWKPLLQHLLPQKVHIICVFCLWEVLQRLKFLAAESGYHMAARRYRCTRRCSGLAFGLGVQVIWVRSLLQTA